MASALATPLRRCPGRGWPALSRRQLHFTPADRKTFAQDGFILKQNVISPADAAVLAAHYEELFAGNFPTGVYPDEWHWRAGISLPTAVREIVNGWKATPAVARIALAPSLGRAAAELLDWSAGTRVAQDDVLWKPAGAGGVGYHTDAAYISDQFVPRDDNSVTVWIALDDADAETGTVEYAVGSHRWRDAAGTDRTSASASDFHGADDVAAPVFAAAARAGIAESEVVLRSVAVPAGAAIFHHQDVWHGSGPNTHATRPRRALAVHLLRRDVHFRATPPPDYIYGRYVARAGASEVSDTFFPVTWTPPSASSELAARGDVVIELTRCGLMVDEEVDGDARDSPTLIRAWAGRGGDGSDEPHDALAHMLEAWRSVARS